ncbi:bifunctional adenosylcobinamide kinase/adenosylcobinamide-phosphate guanylyltransferase [Bacillus sp. FJAT-44742]|uniref:bifunctional adenosylcobinamide kinase/adenosylcobinamide-phosphate guanylyltransferase n=1 Tax=Bacillus sp. FJAT-44742 TaxID=2014005 RepID=UPI0018E23CE5|nr:bifunctional adenosylcobinamide kinase/adenosylcobinamide-phosphate guanylyltransferase [Bacillus sp. FJAT-44742]
MERAMMTFICGGVRSGKSKFGEGLAEKEVDRDGRLIYVATSKITDEEMKSRVDEHQARREGSVRSWETIEKARNLHECVPLVTKRDTVFLDCITTWLSNELFYSHRSVQDALPVDDVKERMMNVTIDLKKKSRHLILISNDIFQAPVPDDPFVYQYMAALGRLHQQLIRLADNAYMVEHDMPLLMKGRNKE